MQVGKQCIKELKITYLDLKDFKKKSEIGFKIQIIRK